MRRRANREETTPRTNTRTLPMNRRRFITMKLEATPPPRLGRQLTPWFKGQVLTSSPLRFYSPIRVNIRFHIYTNFLPLPIFFLRDSPNDSDRVRIYLFSFSIVKSYGSFHLIRLRVFSSSLAAFRSPSRERCVPFRFLLLYLDSNPRFGSSATLITII